MTLSERNAFHEAGHAAACVAYGIPLVSATIADAYHPYVLPGNYRWRGRLAFENLVIMTLAGGEAETYFCGPHAGDTVDKQMAHEYLADHLDAAQIATVIKRLRFAARGFVRHPWAQRRIPRIADALLEYGTMTGAEIRALR
jgi:hypothetical protein